MNTSYVHTIITFLVTASSMKPAELIKVFFCYFLPPGLLHKSDETNDAMVVRKVVQE